MARDDVYKVFDVSKPHKVMPSATSKPIIVGHHPTMNDPMVKEDGSPDKTFGADPKPHAIPVFGTQDVHEDNANPITSHASFSSHDDDETALPPITVESLQNHQDQDSPAHPEEPEHETKDSETVPESHFTPLHSLIDTESADDQPKAFSDHVGGHVIEAEPLPIPRGAGPRRRWSRILGWLLLVIVLLVVAAYVAVDAGLVKSNIKLPFHIFNKQKTSKVTTNPPAPSPSPQPSATALIPAGFTQYSLGSTPISFAYPTAWGTPTATPEAGFSKRGGTNKTDGTYAYLVSFATNKDVQLAITSSKYLPTTRGALYYDYLQWCIGTNDNKIYKSLLHFTTASGVDTPSTVTCDQGPLADATKLDSATIVQLNTKDVDGKTVLGDLYTKNLTSTDLPVLRVKDAAMTNGDNVKKLLSSVKISNSTNPPSPAL